MRAVHDPDTQEWSGRQRDRHRLELALRKHPSILECAVLDRSAGGDGVDLVAYVVPGSALAPDDLLQHLRATGLPRLTRIIPVSSIPLTAAGEADAILLSRLPVNDDELLEQWEARGQSVEGIARVAALRDGGSTPTLPLHLSDVLTDWTPSAATASETPVMPSRATASAASAEPSFGDGGPLIMAPGTPLTLDAVLQDAATSQHGLVYVRPDGSKDTQSYAALGAQALRILGGLQRDGLTPGDRVILQLEGHQDFIETFWACVLGGLVPVPLAVPPAYDKPTAPLQMLQAAQQMLDRPHVVTRRESRDALVGALDGVPGAGERLHILDDVSAGPEGQPFRTAPHDLALLMLTSGSTGTPKAVMLSHRNILSRTAASQQLNGFSAADVSVNWMPLDHVAGLIYFHIRDVYLGCRQIHIPTSAILQDPLRWLDYLDEFRATVTFAPNFAFALVNDREREMAGRRWDLSRLRLVLNGAEAIVARTARKFLVLLGPHGLAPTSMHPAWGMSETSSGVVYGDTFSLASTSDDDHFVEVGRPIPGFSMRIVDRDDRVAREGAIGRLQVRGPSVTKGYLGNAELTRESFTADGWFNTGDLGTMRGGRLTITGREKDVVIINSVNYYCHAIEAVVEALDGVETSFTAACAVRPAGANTDRLAIFFHAGDPLLLPELLGRIRTEVAGKIGIAPDFIVPVEAAAIPKTSLGKIQRTQLAQQFLAGEFDGVLKQVDRLLANAHTIPDWFFRKVWRRKNATCDPASLNERRTALILADRHGLGNELRTSLEQRGVSCTVVHPGERFAELDAATYQLNPRSEEDYQRLIAALGAAPDHIVHLWGYGPYEGEATADTIAGRQFEGALSLVWLTKAIARARNGDVPVSLICVASDVQAVHPGEPVAYEKAAAIALVKSLPQELAWLRCRHVDVPAGDSREIATWIVDEMSASDQDREVAFRNSERQVSALEKLVFPSSHRDAPVFTAGGAYLMTGGLGGVGERVAEVLLNRFGARLLLIGRGRAEGTRQGVLERLRTCGGTVAYEAVDVCREADVAEVLDRYATIWGRRIDGAIHLAGSYYESLAIDDTAERFLDMLRAKGSGTAVLQRTLTERGGGFVISSSSIAAFFGGASISAYAAANSVQEAVAAHFNGRGSVRHYCFSWSNWNGVGFSRDYQLKDALRARGYLPIEPADALHSLMIGLASGESALLVGLDAGHRYIRRHIRDESDLLENLVVYYTQSPHGRAGAGLRELDVRDRYGVRSIPELVPISTMPTTASGSVDKEQLLRLRDGLEADNADDFPRTDAERLLAQIWKDVLGVSSVSGRDNFFESGGDSLLAARLVARLKAAFGGDLTLRDVFDADTLADLAAGVTPRESAPPPIAAAVVTERPLTPGQRALWFLHQLAPGSGAYNITFTARLTSTVDVEALRQAFQGLVDRHEALRTIFPGVRGEPVQQIQVAAPVQFDVEDASALSQRELLDRMALEIRRPFQLATGPVMRVRVFTGADAGVHLAATFHHIIMDGWSFWVCLTELRELYRAALARQSPSLPPIAGESEALARVQSQASSGDAGARHFAFWKQHLGESVPALNLPTDRPHPPVATYDGASERFRLGRDASARLKTIAREARATPQMVMLSLFQILLQRYSGQDDLVIGYLSSGRTRPELETVVGYAANLLALRLQVPLGATFRDLLKQTRGTLLEAFEHQDYPFLNVVDQLSANRDASRSPLFQVLFVYEKPHLLQDENVSSFIAGAVGARLRLGELEFESLPFPLQQEGQFDLTLMVVDDDSELCFTLDYKTALFDRSTVQRLGQHFMTLAESAARDPEQLVAALSMLTVAEQRDLRIWNGERSARPEGGVGHLFEAVATAWPNAIAVVSGDEHITYQALNVKANQLARHLRTLGVTINTTVGLLVERSSVDLVVGILGILKAGGAFVPLDQAQPPERLKFMYRDSGAALLVTQTTALDRLAGFDGRAVVIDRDRAAIEAGRDDNLAIGSAGDLAYVIYTSGSTGQPKGVLLEHRGLVNVAAQQQRLFGPRPGDHVLQFASMSFDAAVFDVVMALCSGAALHLASREAILPGLPLLATLKKERISILTIPPSALANLPVDPLPDLRVVLVAGEACPPELVARWGERRDFFNLYGPTEATIWATYAQCHDGQAVPPIGRPVANTQTYVLDNNLSETPVGVPGELYLGGVGLARGYLNRPELNARSFIVHPLAAETGGRLYKTGDIVRRAADGQLHYVGRVDDQVKLRGFRIELGEIATALCRHPDVDRAVVMVREDTPGDRRLVAYLVPSSAPGPQASALRDFLHTTLPEYMLPAAFVFMDDFPLTVSGKADRLAFPPPTAAALQPNQSFAPPSSGTEQLVARTWQDVLHLDLIGVDDNFFDIGGNSLLMAQVHARLSESVTSDLSIVDLFQYPTIRAIAAHLGRESLAVQAPGSRTDALVAGQARLRDQARRRREGNADHGSANDR